MRKVKSHQICHSNSLIMKIITIGYDRTPNTTTGRVEERLASVGKGFVTLEGEEKKVDAIHESVDQYNRPIIRIVCTDGYEITMADRGIYKEFKFE